MLKISIQIILTSCLLLLLLAFQINHQQYAKNAEALKLLEEKEKLLAEDQIELAIQKVIAAKDIYFQHQEWESVVHCYHEAADLSEQILELHQQQNYIKEALVIINQHLTKKDLASTKIFQKQGEFYLSQGKLDSAILLLNNVKELYDFHEIWEEKAWVTYSIAIAYYYKQDYDNTEKYLKETEEIAKSKNLSGEIYPAVYELLGTLYYSSKKDYEKAIQFTNQSLIFYRNKTPKTSIDSQFIINIHNNIGIYHQAKKDYDRAAHHFAEAISIDKKINTDEFANFETLLNYAQVLRESKEHHLSIVKYKQALALNENRVNTEQQQKYESIICLGLSENYQGLKQIDSAFYFVNKTIHLDKNKKYRTTILKARLHYLNNQYEKALNIIETVETNYSNLSIFSLENSYTTLNILGKIYTSKEDYELALRYYQKAIVINSSNFTDTLNIYALPSTKTEIYDISYFITTLNNKALTLKAMNTPKSLKAAFETNQLAIKYAEKMRQDFVSQASKIDLNERTTTLYQNAIAIAYQLHHSTNDPTYLQEAFVIAEKQKSILLLESLIDKKGKQHYNVPEALLKREEQLKLDIAFYKQQLSEYKGQDSTKYELYKGYHTNKNLELAQLKDTLSKQYKSYFETEYQTSIATVQKIQKELLLPEQAFIQYLAIDSLFYVFVVEKDKQHFLALPKNEQTIIALQKMQTTLHAIEEAKKAGLSPFKDFTSSAYQSYQNILEPVLSHLSPTISELIISPDEVLNYLPFECLLTKAITTNEVDFLRLPYLIYQYQFHYGYSGTLLLENEKQYKHFKGNDKMLAYAPAYKVEEPNLFALRGNSTALRSSAVPLEGTGKEIRKIQAYFQGMYVFDTAATKNNFQQEAKNYGILHLAMHGVPNYKEPDYAHLIFSNTSNNSTNLLHHYEIAALETNAQIAVLSACETGVGKELEGEGVMSLGRAFMYAGVPSVVMSLWKMNDQSTSELMPLFYKYLALGKRKNQSLHQAKIDYLSDATPLSAHPYYWAGFIVNGNTQPIKKTSKQYWIWWLVGGIICILTGNFFLKKKKAVITI